MTSVSPPAFLVVVHDVAEPFTASVLTVLRALEPLVQQNIAAAVVPCWHGQISVQRGSTLHTSLREQCGEIVLHGYTHHCRYPAHPLALLTGNANEFSGLSRMGAAMRLWMGKMLLTRWFDSPIRGFAPPAWQYGPLDHHLLGAAGFAYGLRFFRFESVCGNHQPLATWSWDTGRIAALGVLGDLAGHMQKTMQPDRLPCLVFHPSDIQRGFLARGLRLVQALIDAGYRPVLPGCRP